MRYLLMGIFLTITAPAMAVDDWTDRDTVRQIIIASFQLKDRDQTIQMQRDGYFERNPILGEHPSAGKINTWFGFEIAGSYAVNRYLIPSSWRPTTQYLTIGLAARTVYLNDQVEHRVGFTISVQR